MRLFTNGEFHLRYYNVVALCGRE